MAGQERFRAITAPYYRGAHGAMMVYDITKRKTFENLIHWLSQLQQFSDKNTRSSVYKKRSKNMSSLDFDFLYSCFLFSRTHFG